MLVPHWFLHFIHGQHVMNMNCYMKVELTGVHIIYGWCSVVWGRYPTIWQPHHETLARCIWTWQNMDPSEPQLKILGGREQHEQPYSKRVCFMLLTEILVPMCGHLPVQPEDLEQLPILHYKGKPYICFMYKEACYYSQMITHDV